MKAISRDCHNVTSYTQFGTQISGCMLYVGEPRKLGGALALHTEQLEGRASSHLFQHLSILLVKGKVINGSPGQLHPPQYWVNSVYLP